jgi:hypothetical protein
MGAGLVQLLFRGQQDIYLTSNPSMSFFKRVYRTHTNFAAESIRVEFNRSDANIYQTTLLKAKLKRHADLVAQVYLVIELPDILSDNIMNFRWIENIGEAIIDNCQVTIGGNIIDKQTGEYMHAVNCLTTNKDKQDLYNKMTGNTEQYNNPEQFQLDYNNLSRPPLRYRVGGSYPSYYGEAFIAPGEEDNFEPSIPRRKIYIPLQFWFNKDFGSALPLISLQYAEVEISIEIRALTNLYKIFYSRDGKQDYYAPSNYINAHKLSKFVTNVRQRFLISEDILNIDAHLEVNYIYLDALERRYFAYKPLEYLVEQVTRIERIDLEQNNVIDFVLQNPVKELIWFLRRNDAKNRNAWFDFTDGNLSKIMKTAKIMFNGVDRIDEKDSEYFNWLQPYQHHTGTGKIGLYCYSFSLYPEEYQPSGSVNMSRINKIQFMMRTKKTRDVTYKYDVVFYVVNYNILRVMSGIASVAYSL